MVLAFFFFSSRRRHTRWPRDWSSDVCSSDLGGVQEGLELDLDAPFAQLVEHIGALVLGQLGEYEGGGVDQHEADVGGMQIRVVAQRVADHVLGLGHGLTAGEAAADEGEGEQSLADLGILGGDRKSTRLNSS